MFLAPFGLLLRLLLEWVCGYAAATHYSPRRGRRRRARDSGNVIGAELSGSSRGCHPVRTFTARASTIPIVTSEVSDCTSISIFAIGVSGIVSVGLKAEALVNEV